MGGGDANKSMFFSRVPAAPSPENLPLDGMKKDSERLARHVIATGEVVNVPNAINHKLAGGFIQGPDDEGVGKLMVLVHNVLCVPVTDADGTTIGAVEVMNKQGEQNHSFTEGDTVSLQELAQLVSAATQRSDTYYIDLPLFIPPPLLST